MPLPRVRRFRRSLVRGLPGVPRPRAALPSEGVLGLKILGFGGGEAARSAYYDHKPDWAREVSGNTIFWRGYLESVRHRKTRS